MTNEAGSAAAANTGWLKKALIASLAVNLLIVGGVAGSFISHHRHGGWHGRHGFGGDERGLLSFLRELPDSRREALRPWLEGEREKVKPLKEAVRQSWSDVNGVLGAETFDKEKFKAALGKQIENELKLRAAIADAVIETAAKLEPAERARLKEWREKRGQRFLKHLGGRE